MVDLIMRVRVDSSGWQGDDGINAFYFRPLDPGTEALNSDAGEAFNRVQAAYVDWRQFLPTNWTGVIRGEVEVIEATTGTLVGLLYPEGDAVVLGNSGSAFGASAAGLCINWNTEELRNGRRIKGRSFISPVSGNGDANGSPSGTMLDNANGGASALTQQIAEPIAQVVWSRPKDGPNGRSATVSGHRVRDSFSMLTSRR